MNYPSRIKKLQNILQEKQLPAFLISNPTNIYYLTGFSGLAPNSREAFAVATKRNLHLFTSQMYGQGLNVPSHIHLHIIKSWDDVFGFLKRYHNKGRVAFETSDLRHSEFKKLNAQSPRLMSTKNIVENLRIIKSKEEIKHIRKAAQITDKAFETVIKQIKPGLTEKKVARMLISAMEDFGATDIAFDPIVAFGKNSAKPHHKTGNTKLTKGPLLIDMGAKYKGYCADMTRTIYVGKPSKDFLITYNKVKDVLINTLERVKPETKIQELSIIANKQFGKEKEHFLHSLGHGVGLDIHERPFANSKTKAILKPGMILTIEPGLYYSNWGGIRLEELILLTSKGIQILSQATFLEIR